MASVSHDDYELRRNAREIAEGKLGFYIHLAAYAAANSLIFLIWWFTGGYYVWIFPWFVFPLAFWGAGVLVHYVCVFPPYSGSGYIERRAEQEYRRLKIAEEEQEERRRRRKETATA